MREARAIEATAWTLAIAALVSLLGLPARADSAVPIRLAGTINESPIPDAACRGMRNETQGLLMGTLGRARWSSVECIDATAEPGSFVIRDGRIVLKTTRGSLTGTVSGHASGPNARGHLHFSGRFSITKGTQRYEGVKGNGLAIADVNLSANTAELDLAGTLMFPR
jgi:hypothetical protein